MFLPVDCMWDRITTTKYHGLNCFKPHFPDFTNVLFKHPSYFAMENARLSPEHVARAKEVEETGAGVDSFHLPTQELWPALHWAAHRCALLGSDGLKDLVSSVFFKWVYQGIHGISPGAAFCLMWFHLMWVLIVILMFFGMAEPRGHKGHRPELSLPKRDIVMILGNIGQDKAFNHCQKMTRNMRCDSQKYQQQNHVWNQTIGFV